MTNASVFHPSKKGKSEKKKKKKNVRNGSKVIGERERWSFRVPCRVCHVTENWFLPRHLVGGRGFLLVQLLFDGAVEVWGCSGLLWPVVEPGARNIGFMAFRSPGQAAIVASWFRFVVLDPMSDGTWRIVTAAVSRMNVS